MNHKVLNYLLQVIKLDFINPSVETCPLCLTHPGYIRASYRFEAVALAGYIGGDQSTLRKHRGFRVIQIPDFVANFLATQPLLSLSYFSQGKEEKQLSLYVYACV